MRWKIRAIPEEGLLQKLQQELGINRELSILLAQRGIDSYTEARRFFLPLEQDLHDPFLMADMQKAVDRCISAIQNREKIMVFGDYDVDGTTSVALMVEFLRQLDVELLPYIPDRYDEGYGLSEKGMRLAAEEGCGLIIALDCGIKGHTEVALANSLGVDMVICDHHQPGNGLPPAHAILDPKRSDCSYPFKELSGCGVGFKLAQAISMQMQRPVEALNPLYDLLAVSIAADIVPVVGENRSLLARGLERINSSPRVGLKCLQGLSGRTGPLGTEELVFQISPRINAAGRIAHGSLAVDLLTTQSEERANELAAQINELNTNRRSFDERIGQEALEQLEGTEDSYTSVVFNPEWHKGVIGIAASRLIETHYRPTVVLTRSGEVLAGSARSVHGFDLYSAIDRCREHLIQFGGHAFAAGMTMREDQLQSFRTAFEESVKSHIREDQRIPGIDIDLLVDLSFLDRRFYNTLERMGPFGPGNMKPVLATFGLIDDNSRTVGEDGAHLKLSLRDGEGVCMEGIAFRMGDRLSMLKAGPVDIAYTLDINRFRGEENLQLNVKAIRPSQQAS